MRKHVQHSLLTVFLAIGFITLLFSQTDSLERGRELFKKGNYNEAIRVLESYVRSVEENSSQIKKYAEANYLLAKIYYEAGEDRQVEKYLTKALQADRGIGDDEVLQGFKDKIDKLNASLPDTGLKVGAIARPLRLIKKIAIFNPQVILSGTSRGRKAKNLETGEQAKVYEDLKNEALKVIQAHVRKNELSLVLDTTTSGVAYAREDLDISNLIAQEVDASSNVDVRIDQNIPLRAGFVNPQIVFQSSRKGKEILERLTRLNRSELEKAKEVEFGRLKDEILPVIGEIARHGEFDLIFDLSTMGAAYIDPRLDLTDKLIEIMDGRLKVTDLRIQGEDIKFAYVIPQELLSNSILGKEALARMMAFQYSMQKKYDGMRKTNAGELEMKRYAEDAQREAMSMQQREFTALQNKIMPIVSTIAKRRGIALVFDLNSAGIAGIDPGLDITDTIRAELDRKPN